MCKICSPPTDPLYDTAFDAIHEAGLKFEHLGVTVRSCDRECCVELCDEGQRHTWWSHHHGYAVVSGHQFFTGLHQSEEAANAALARMLSRYALRFQVSR